MNLLETEKESTDYTIKRNVISQAEIMQLTKIEEKYNVNISLLLLSSFQILLYKYTHQREIRTRIFDDSQMVTFHNCLADDAKFIEISLDVQNAYMESKTFYNNQSSQLTESELLNIEFQHKIDSEYDLKDWDKGNKLDAVFYLLEEENRLEFMIGIRKNLLHYSIEKQIVEHFHRLLKDIFMNIGKQIYEISILTADEYNKVVYEWNATESKYPLKSVNTLIEEQVDINGSKTAIIFNEQTLTYDEFNKRVNKLANYLIKQGVGIGTPVGICLKRSIELIVGIFGIMKAGGIYVPLDSSYPKKRLKYMVEDTEVIFILTQKELGLKVQNTELIFLEDIKNDISKESYENPENNSSIDDVAYIMYTSGSTGKPKGVLVPHRAIIRLVKGANYVDLSSNEIILQFASISFDASTFEIFGSLLNGGTLVLFPPYMPSLDELGNVISNYGITTLWLTAGLFHEMVENNLEDLKNVRQLLAGGDVLLPSDIKKVMNRFKDMTLINGYGPTENTTFTCCYPVENPENIISNVPIGKPISNTKVYILDNRMQPVPVGVIGELYAGGDGLSHGYLNNEKLTQERFVLNPFGNKSEDKIYRTGDYARYLPDGNIEFLGRIDNQVKIRGFRIELGEIEALLRAHDDVNDAIVLSHEFSQSDKRIVAYILPENKKEKVEEEDEDLKKEQVLDWEVLFNSTYSLSDNNSEKDFNIVGWNSSYTGNPIPEEEMREWVDNTIDRIRELNPQNVLELCCGTGLLLYRIAPHSNAYWASDLSETVIDILDKQVQSNEDLSKKVKLFKGEANDFQEIPTQFFDCVVINSATQYFPDIHYLKEVIENSIEVIRPGGSIFLGDLRNLKLLSAYHASVELFKATDSMECKKLKDNIQKSIIQENELLIDPEFFLAMAKKNHDIDYVEILPKRGKHLNEITQFRYDVILHVKSSHEATTNITWLDWDEEKLTLPAVMEYLDKNNPQILGVKRVQNKRVIEGVKAYEYLTKQDVSGTTYDLKTDVKAIIDGINAVYPEDFERIESTSPYKIELSWLDNDCTGAFDVIIYKGEEKPILSKNLSSYNQIDKYVNNPLQGKFFEKIIPRLKSYIKKSLPEYMKPAYYMLIDEVPLTSNGKVNRKALPHPVLIERDRGYTPPNNQNEELIASFFAQILGCERVGIYDNFFELGGNSLLATQVISRIRDTFGVVLLLRVIFEFPTVSGLSKKVEALLSQENNLINKPIVHTYSNKDLPISFGQQRIKFLQELYPDSTEYSIPMAFHIKGDLNVSALIKSLKEIVNRHSILRTSFETTENKMVQNIYPAENFDVPLIEYGLSNYQLMDQVMEEIKNDMRQPFNLSKGPLFKTTIYRLGENEYILYMNMHHTVSDGWSMRILFSELSTLYSGYIENRNNILDALPIQYTDFAIWQRKNLEGKITDSQLNYWKEQLQGELSLVKLPTNRRRSEVMSFKGGVYRFTISKDITEGVKQLSRQEGVTLYMVFLAAFKTLLNRYTGQEDILIGSPIANRTNSQIEGLIGFFVNVLVMRSDLSGDPTFLELIKRIKEVTLSAFANQDISFEKVVAEIQPGREAGYSPLVNVLFQIVPQFDLQLQSLDVTSIQLPTESAKYDLYLPMLEVNGEMVCRFEYNQELYDEHFIIQMANHFKNILRSIIGNPMERLYELKIMNKREETLLAVELNNTCSNYSNLCIHQLFEEQVKSTPNKIAVECDGESLTYCQLNRKANRMARLLKEKDIRQGSMVAIMLDSSIDIIIGILSILKTGAAYVPIDPKYPKDRIQYIIRDSKAKLLITSNSYNKIEDLNSEVIYIEDSNFITYDDNNLEIKTSPDDLAYVMYTSGTTGKPKGILTMHSNVIRVVQHTNYIDITPHDVILQTSNYAFDGSTFNIYGALLNGAKLVLLRDVHEASLMIKAIENEKVTLFFITTQLFNIFVDLYIDKLKNVRKILFGGESASIKHVRKALDMLGEDRIINMYGPTESTVFTTYYPINKIEDNVSSIPIGKAISNTQIYILDKHNNIVPIGVEGELCISGDGLARGYLGREELTHQKFIDHPFIEGKKLYKTGDVARYLSDGNIEFCGRVDHQVKIRGFRIELGEIETHLLMHQEVNEAVVIVREDVGKGKYLCAYVVSKRIITHKELKKYLSKKMPEYMIPSYFIHLESMPLTANDKVDRDTLLNIDVDIKTSMEYIAPKNKVEEQLVGLWEQILNRKKIGTDDNFFELGGHSLNVIQLVAKINNHYNCQIKLRDIFTYPTISSLAQYIMEFTETKPKETKITSRKRNDALPLSFGQKQLWFFDQYVNNSPLYNVPHVWRIKGKVDLLALHNSFIDIIMRHEILRTTYKQKDGIPIQVINKDVNFSMTHDDLSGIPKSERECVLLERCKEEVKKPFNLTQGPLIRVNIIKLSENELVMITNLHHIACDGWSMDILYKELTKLYSYHINKTEEYLSELPIQYGDYAIWQQEWKGEDEYQRLLSFWENKLGGDYPILRLPLDKERPLERSFVGTCERFYLSKELSEALEDMSKNEGATLFMTLLAAFNVVLYKYTRQTDIVIGSPVANRNYSEIQELIGYFVNMLVLRTDISGNPTFREILRRVREVTLEAYDHQEFPFEKLVEKLHPKRNVGTLPLFQVVFALENATHQPLDLWGTELSNMEVYCDISKFDLCLIFREEKDGLSAWFEYSTDLFEATTIKNIFMDLQDLLEMIVRNPDEQLFMLTLKSNDIYEDNDVNLDEIFDELI